MVERYGVKNVDVNLIKLVPKGIAMRYCVIPIQRRGNTLVVAIADPENALQLDDLESHTGFNIEAKGEDTQDIVESIRKFYQLNDADFDELKNKFVQTGGPPVYGLEINPQEVAVEAALDDYLVKGRDKFDVQEAPPAIDESTRELINGTLERAIEVGAEEIHVERINSTTTLRLRINGVLVPDLQLPPMAAEPFFMRLREMASMELDSTLNFGSGVYFHRINNRDVSYHAWWYRSQFSERMVLKICDLKRGPTRIVELGLIKKDIQFLVRACRRSRGLIVCSSPARQGSTTTMLALMHALGMGERISYLLNDDQQCGDDEAFFFDPEKSGMTYLEAVEHLIASGAEVICIEHLERPDRAQAALRASRSVITLATMRANDCVNAFIKLPSDEYGGYGLLEAEISISCQRLIRRLCEDCKQQADERIEALRKMGIQSEDDDSLTLFEPVGCDSCNNTGYSGRMGIFQTLFITEEIKDQFLRRAKTSELRQTAKKQGMNSLRQLGLQMVFNGRTALEDVFWTTFKAEE
ncbi:hypothetical protein JW905_14685 [bacterium]|nr:hypothetical protein [candidate division CSSED10-310 bacterium]